MSGVQKELEGKGFRVVEAAINENPDVPGFIRQFDPPFPVGTVPNMKALEFMEISAAVRSFVPLMAFVDRSGMIRAQYTGSDAQYFTNDMAKQAENLRADAEKLLAEKAKPAVRKKAAKTRSAR